MTMTMPAGEPAPALGPDATKRPPARSIALVALPLGLILAVGLALRLAGITHGQPFISADEWIVGKGAMHVLTARTWNVTYYYYPTLLTYLLVPVAAVLHVVGHVPLTQTSAGLDRVEALPAEFPIFLAGRLLVALLGLATILVSFESARRLVGPRVALVGAAVVAFSGLLVFNSQYLVTDVPSALMAALALLAAIIAWQRRSLRWVLGSALLAGLAASTKYNVGLVVVVAVLAWASLVPWRRIAGEWRTGAVAGRPGRLLRGLEWRTAILIPIMAIVGLVVATPAVILAPGLIRQYLQLQAAAYQIDASPLVLPSLGYNLQYLSDSGLGPVASILVLVGLVRMAVRHRPPDLFVLVFGLAYLALMSAPPLHFSRNLCPLIPFAGIAAAEAAGFLVEAVRAAVARPGAVPAASRRLAVGVAAAVLALALVNPLGVGVAATSELAKTDTRVRAFDWLEANVPAGTKIARDGYTPVLTGPRFVAQSIWPLAVHDIAWYRSHGYAYLVLSDYSYGRLPPESAQGQVFSAMLALPSSSGRPGSGCDRPDDRHRSAVADREVSGHGELARLRGVRPGGLPVPGRPGAQQRPIVVPAPEGGLRAAVEGADGRPVLGPRRRAGGPPVAALGGPRSVAVPDLSRRPLLGRQVALQDGRQCQLPVDGAGWRGRRLPPPPAR